MDLLFARMQKHGIRLDQICGISGSGQQHGSVYLNADFEKILGALDPKKNLARQLQAALSRRTAPIWMDHSTQEECRALTERFGTRLQTLTGSAAAERFTGPQIMKFAKQDPPRWNSTARVHLVSSFLCSVAAGLGAAVYAAHAVEKIPFPELSEIFCRSEKTIHPNSEYAAGYEKQKTLFLAFLKKEILS